MIVQTFTVILILSVTLICDVTGASYSNVYVESEVAPIGYYAYGTPYPSITNPRLSQINSLPSVTGYVAPCVSPCVYPAQTFATGTPVNPSPNILTYNAPSVPFAVAPTKQEATGYEYSYAVYDENTGDNKAQRELSDGSVVRGEYSFLQPDGYVRQVQYVADDISGFNAVVKQFLPAAVEGNRKVAGQENKESSPPCHEIQNESLKEESEENPGEIKKISKDHQGTSKESGEEENSKEKQHKETKKIFKEESGEESEAESHENKSKKHSKEASGEGSAEKSNEKSIKLKHSKGESEEESKEKPHIAPKPSKEESGEESKEKPHIKPKHSKEEPGEESKEKSIEIHQNNSKKVSNEDSGEESEHNSKEETLHKSSKETEESKEKNKNKSMKGSKEGSDEDSGEESGEVGHGKHKEVYGLLKPNQEVHALLKPNQEALVPYNDILRCIEAAMRRNYGVPAAMRQEPSPLTYIVLNKPC